MTKHIDNQLGFTILEVTCAIVILTVGLMGVAAMQAKSIQGNAFASSLVESSINAEEWMEWVMDFVNRTDQGNVTCSGKINRINYCTMASLDSNDGDDAATEIAIPNTMSDLLQLLSDNNFQNPGGVNFTAEQVPGPPGAGYSMVWRVLANSPVQDTTTIEVVTTCNNAFAFNRRTTLRFIIASNM